jgi:hypothetical protein
MSKTKIKTIIILISLFCALPVYGAQAYREQEIPQGKVIFGLGEEEILNKYGPPTSTDGKIWYYSGPERLYVFLDKTMEVYLYPSFCKSYVGVPMELRTFAGLQEINDVTLKSQLVLSDQDAFNVIGPGVLVPKKAGEYQIMSVYNDIYSNTSFVSVAESKKEPEAEEEQLVSIDIFPYKPYMNPGTTVYFYAFGTFVFRGSYSVREITRQAEWFSEMNGAPTKLPDSKITSLPPGQYKVFCKYKGLQSIPQDMEAASVPMELTHDLKQVAIVPTNVAVTVRSEVPFHAFATYQDNSVEEVTKKILWVIGDKAILDRGSDNIFIARLAGVTDLQGVFDNLRSLPAKIVVSASPVSKPQSEKTKKQEKNLSTLLEDIKNDIKGLKDKNSGDERFKYIRIVPDYCDIRAGDQKQLSAFGVRQDNTEEDITIMAKWKSSNEALATVKSGMLTGVSPGETNVCVQYKNIDNQCIPVFVRGAELVSIAVSPSRLKMDTSEKADLRAEGYYNDSSHTDITSSATWGSNAPNIAKMDKNKVLPVRVGLASVYAEYSGVRSLPVEVEVVLEKNWLLKLIIKIIFLLVLLILVLYSCFYVLGEQAKERILKLYADPRNFIISLYSNLGRVCAILGMHYKFYMPPLFFAGMVDEKFAIRDNLFFKFAQQYEEAKYSSHSFAPEVSAAALESYNKILEAVFARQGKMALACIYLAALISRTPLFMRVAKTTG